MSLHADANVKPSHYDLWLKPDLEAFTFAGRETITVHVAAACKTITLHALEIVISSASLNGAAAEVSYVAEQHTATLTFAAEVPAGEARLEIHFTGTLNDQMVGFYRSHYQLNGAKRYMACTQFESCDARRAFPCWDDPSDKATFAVTLCVPSDRKALSNMPVVKAVPCADTNTTSYTYDVTPKMSTYLLAFVVGDFDYVEGTNAEGTLCRTYTPVGLAEQGRFANDCLLKTLSYYKEFFGIAYPLPKCDQVAIADFSAGAMENWGLITYRETAVLIDMQKSTLAQKQRVAYVVGHEAAHQWFGNRTTMKGWEGLWLNEGFATWVGNLAVDYMFPEWDIWINFGTSYCSRAMDLDALKSTHPIEQPVNSCSEAAELFDAISYMKGASVIHMLVDHLGRDNFRKGIETYLKAHAYANATTSDLWAGLASASPIDVAAVYDPWVRMDGFPVISVQTKGLGKAVSVSQSRFFAAGPTECAQTWPVPITLTTSNDSAQRIKHLLQSPTETIAVDGADTAQWVKLNAGQCGFYRVRYEPEMLIALGKACGARQLPAADRLGLVNDAFALAGAGYIPTDVALSLVKEFGDEDDSSVWQEITSSVHNVRALFQHEAFYDKLASFINTLYSKAYHRLGWDAKAGEPATWPLQRSLVLSSLAAIDNEDVIRESRLRFAQLDNPAAASALSPDLRSLVYSVVVRNGGVEEFEKVFAIFRNADMHEERIRALSALASTKDPVLIKRYLEYALDKDVVRPQDAFICVGRTGASRWGRDLTWEWLKENFDRITKTFVDGFLRGRIVASACDSFSSEEKAKEVEDFFRDKDTKAFERKLAQALETVRTRAAWLRRDSAALAAYFA